MKKIIDLIFTMLAMHSMGVQGQEKTEMVYPQAEWSKAGDILMYTPGQELFNGVIHPSAGLFGHRGVVPVSLLVVSFIFGEISGDKIQADASIPICLLSLLCPTQSILRVTQYYSVH